MIPVPPAPKPAIVLSNDSISATLISGAAGVTQEIDVTAGTTTALSGLALVDTVPPGRDAWLAVSLSGTTAPAKLVVRLLPTTVVAGKYGATIRVGATDAESKTVRVSLDVRPRPRLVLTRNAIALEGEVGSSFATQSIEVTSVDGAIDSLSVSKHECAGVPSPWVTPTLSATKAPATLQFKLAASALKAGTYECATTIATNQTLVDSASQVVKVSLSLRAVPRITLSSDSLHVSVFRLSDTPPTAVTITNSGSGDLGELSLGPIAYDAAGSGWLSAWIDSTAKPAKLYFVASAQTIGAGSYLARIPIRSSATNVENGVKSVIVTFAVSPRPSALVVVPSTINVTIKAGALGRATWSVTHSGDAPLNNMGFAPHPNGWPSWVQPYLGCQNPAVFSTPCTGGVELSPPVSVAPGVYAFVLNYGAFFERSFASATVRVTVTP